MKRFCRGFGIALMCFGGIGVTAVLFNFPAFFRSGGSSPVQDLPAFIILLAVFTGFILLGFKLKKAGGNAPVKQSARVAPQYEPRHRAVDPEAQKTPSQTPNPPAPGSVLGEKKPSGLQSHPTVHEILGLPEEVELTSCPFSDQLEDIGPDGLDDESHVALWLRPREGADAASTIRGLADCLKQIGTRASALQKEHFVEYWSITKRDNYLYVLLVDDPHWLDGVPADVLALCRENEKKTICAAVLIKDGIRDLVTCTEYTLQYQEWPGSADDAATYGMWRLKENKPAAKADAVPDPGFSADRTETSQAL